MNGKVLMQSCCSQWARLGLVSGATRCSLRMSFARIVALLHLVGRKGLRHAFMRRFLSSYRSRTL
jgi:hypothetical protein